MQEKLALKEKNMKNILSKWNITPEELNQATDELCAKGIAKGCYQNTSALLAAVDLLTAGDIEVEKMLADFCAYVAKRYNVVELEISAPARADEVSEFLNGRNVK